MSLFIDLEMNTTDARLVHKKDLRNKIIEIGAVRMDDDFHPLDWFRIFVRPQYNGVIERKIYKLTGISNVAVSDAVSLPEALDALEAWCGSDGCEIYAWSTSDLTQLRKECRFKGIESIFLDEIVLWHDFQKEFRQLLGEAHIMSLSSALHRAGLEPEECLHDDSWDAYNSARLMKTAYSPNFAADLAKAQAACYQEAPKIQGGLPLDVMKKLAALLQSSQPEPAMVVQKKGGIHMKRENLWERRYVTMRIVYKDVPQKDFTKMILFDCDSNIAEAVRLFTEKGYNASYNSYEGRPYREVPSEDDGKYYRKYKNVAFFDGGGISFGCTDEECRMILDRMNAKGDYFSINEHTDIWAARQFIRWEPLYTASIDGHKNSPARFESMIKIFRMVYEDIWRIVLEVAQEVPYKEHRWVESAAILPESEHSDDRSQRIYTLKQNGDFDYNESWMYDDLDEDAKAYLKAKAETEAELTAYEQEKAAMNAEK